MKPLAYALLVVVLAALAVGVWLEIVKSELWKGWRRCQGRQRNAARGSEPQQARRAVEKHGPDRVVVCSLTKAAALREAVRALIMALHDLGFDVEAWTKTHPSFQRVKWEERP